MKKRFYCIVTVMMMTALLLAGCAGKSADLSESKDAGNTKQDETKDAGTSEQASGEGSETKEEPEAVEEPAPAEEQEDGVKASHFVDIEIENYGTITVALIESEAPETVKNFVDLVQQGFYDGLTFHRIISGFMIQGGDPLGNGTGGSEKEIKGEFMNNGVNNRLSHVRGAISMARSDDPNSASSQFFIVHEDSTFLDGNYACFGYVTEGMEVVDKICTDARPVDNNGTIPSGAQPIIKSIKLK